MGWISHKLPKKDWMLYTRGGTCGVFIKKKNTEEKIEIPSALLKMLVAEDILFYKIDDLEQMDNNQILGLPKNHTAEPTTGVDQQGGA